MTNLTRSKFLGLLSFCLIFSLASRAQTVHDTTSYVQTVDVQTGRIDTVLIAKGDYEAPNWHPDNYLVMNFRGKMYKLDLSTKALTVINTGTLTNLMDDHGLSPDGKWMGITNTDAYNPTTKNIKFSFYTVPVTGGEPKRVSVGDISFWHSWSPDGKTIAYCGGGDFANLDVYTIPAEGGTPKRLTETPGLDDGPDYSADGKYIYFHSYRTGNMQIWRMHTDGSQPEQMSFDKNSNWFPHPSPNNKWIAYIAYTSDQKQNHPFGQDVKLRLMNVKTKAVKDITPVFFGGAGTINTPSWNAGSKKIAFVSYSVK